MSERPIPYQWGVAEVNYGAGADPWDGQPILSAPASDYFTPKTGLAAEELNYVLNKTSTDIAALGAFVGQDASLNWPAGLKTGAFNPFVHDPVNGRWIVGAASTQLSSFYDPQVSTANFGTTLSSNPQIVIADTTTGNIFAVEATTKIAIITPAGVVTENTGPAQPVTNSGANGTFFAGRFVYWSVNVSTLSAWYSPAAGTSFTAATPPGGGYPGGSNLWKGSFAKSASTLLAFPQGGAMSTTDGITWSSVTLPTIGTEIVVGAGYSTVEGLFYVCLETLSGSLLGGSSRVLISSTGATGSWTVASTWAHDIVAFAVHGSELCAVAYLNGVYRIVTSVDKGAHWGLGRLAPVAGSTTFYANAFLAVGGNHFAVFDSTHTALSQSSGPSQAIV